MKVFNAALVLASVSFLAAQDASEKIEKCLTGCNGQGLKGEILKGCTDFCYTLNGQTPPEAPATPSEIPNPSPSSGPAPSGPSPSGPSPSGPAPSGPAPSGSANPTAPSGSAGSKPNSSSASKPAAGGNSSASSNSYSLALAVIAASVAYL